MTARGGNSLLVDLAALVECESPSNEPTAAVACAKVLDDIVTERLGVRAQWHEVEDRPHLLWTFGRPRVLLLGHLDTVWPLGTLARWPFTVDGDVATGPGAFDMKGGLVQLVAALGRLDDLDGVAVLVTSDEEIGSPTSRELIEHTARGLEAALVFEPSLQGALKTARKGVGMFTVEVHGRAAHAGLEPELGINATVEAARQALALAELARPELGTTVTPTALTSGTTVNTVPAYARLSVDVRTTTVAEMDRVIASVNALQPFTDGATLSVTAEGVRAPLESSASAGLFQSACAIAHELGLGPLDGVAVGGGSDGNLTAALGVPTLDGLGAVGGNAHAEGEWLSVPAMAERIELTAGLIRHVLNGKTGR